MPRFPEQWGKVKVADLGLVDEEDGELEELEWRTLTDPAPDGRRHGSRGSILPDTVVLMLDDVPVALCDPAMLQINNYLVWDCEYYFALRLRQILDAERWATTPLGAYAPPTVIYAEDKFHWCCYQRGLFGEDETMSFGGYWEDLEAEVADVMPLPEGQPAPISTMALQRAVDDGDLDRVRELLAAGADPRGCPGQAEALPALQHRHERGTSPAWSAAADNVDPAILVCLLEAGIDPEQRTSSEHMTLLHGAVANGRVAQARILLAWGADPRTKWKGKDALELAGDNEEIVTLLRRWAPPAGR